MVNRPEHLSLEDQLRASRATDILAVCRNAIAKLKADDSLRAELLATEMLFSGLKTEGISYLRKLESVEPDVRPGLAAKLSMAYELVGDNRQAQQWGREYLRRDPEARDGSGWLLQLILSAKVKIAEDPAWLKSHHVLEIDAKSLRNPEFSIKMGDQVLNKRDIQGALFAQLKDRMMWVKPRDPVVADLLYIFALVERSADAPESAAKLLDFAREYGYSVPPLMQVEFQAQAGR